MNNLEPKDTNIIKDENIEKKFPCEVVEDLLPLYEEGLVGEETAKLIENHAQNCPNCREKLFALKKQEKLPCETIVDLLPLYNENMVGEVTGKLIENHLKTCNSCKEKLALNKAYEKLTCNTIDELHLLPLYEDRLIGEETAKQIEEHLKSCPNCNEKLRLLQEEIKEKPLELTGEERPSSFAQAAPLKKMKKELSRRRRNSIFLAISLVLLAAVMIFTVTMEFRYIPYKEGNISVSKGIDGTLTAEFNSEILDWNLVKEDTGDGWVYYLSAYNRTANWRDVGVRKINLTNMGFVDVMPYDFAEGEMPGNEAVDRAAADLGKPVSVVYVDYGTEQFHLLYGEAPDHYDEEIFTRYNLGVLRTWGALPAALWALVAGLAWLFLTLLYKYKWAAVFKYLCLGISSLLLGILICNVISTTFVGPGVMGANIIMLAIPIFGILVFGLSLLKQHRQDRKG